MPQEKTHWTGSPHRIAMAFTPAMAVSAVLSAVLSLPAFTGPVSAWAQTAGISAAGAAAVAFLPAATVALKGAWGYLVDVTTVYALTSDRLVVRRGILVRAEDEVELYRVLDAVEHVNVLQRLIGAGTVTVASSDRTGTVTMRSIRGSGRVRNGLRRLAERCKSRRGVRILE